MRKKIIIVLIVIVSIALILFFALKPDTISMRVTGAELDTRGNVIAEGEFALEARYQDHQFTLTHLELPNLEVLKPGTWEGDPCVFLSDPNDPDLLITTYSLELPHSNGKEGYVDSVIVFIYTDTEFSHFLISYQDSLDQTHYYVGTESDGPSYQQILTMHKLLNN